MKKLIVVFVIIILASGGILLVRHKKAKLAAAPTPTARPTPVRMARAKTGTIADIRNYLARVEPWQTAELSSQITGRIVKIVPREGDEMEIWPMVHTFFETLCGALLNRSRHMIFHRFRFATGAMAHAIHDTKSPDELKDIPKAVSRLIDLETLIERLIDFVSSGMEGVCNGV